MGYYQEKGIGSKEFTKLNNLFSSMVQTIKQISVNKASRYIKAIPNSCKMHYESLENRKMRDSNINKLHPIIPKRGEIYNAYITEGVGSELCNNHLVIVIQNNKGNMYSEKVNVVPIEGDGLNVNTNYQMQLSNANMMQGHLDKDPSRIIISEIITLDKARLGRKIGKIDDEFMKGINNLLRKQLSI